MVTRPEIPVYEKPSLGTWKIQFSLVRLVAIASSNVPHAYSVRLACGGIPKDKPSAIKFCSKSEIPCLFSVLHHTARDQKRTPGAGAYYGQMSHQRM